MMWICVIILLQCIWVPGKKGCVLWKTVGIILAWKVDTTYSSVIRLFRKIKKNAKPDIQLIDQTRRKWPGCQMQHMQHSGNYNSGAGLLNAKLSENNLNKESEFWMSNED